MNAMERRQTPADVDLANGFEVQGQAVILNVSTNYRSARNREGNSPTGMLLAAVQARYSSNRRRRYITRTTSGSASFAKMTKGTTSCRGSCSKIANRRLGDVQTRSAAAVVGIGWAGTPAGQERTVAFLICRLLQC